MAKARPKLIVFDLDYTLWPFWVDTHFTPPYRKDEHGCIRDVHNTKVKCYTEAPQILKTLFENGYSLGVASRTTEINGANNLINLFNWEKYFTYKEIYPGCKVTHFNKIHSLSGIDLKDMIFFDDEYRNVKDLNEHGVVSILVENGVSQKVIERGFQEFSRHRKN